MTIKTTCSRCGKQNNEPVKVGDKVQYPKGWRHFDYNDIGPDSNKIFDLCPSCLTTWDKDELAKMRAFVQDYI